MRLVTRAVDERDRMPLCQRAKAIELILVLLHQQLGAIAALKFRPALRIIVEPFSQLCTGCDIFHPIVERGFFLAHAAQPKPIDEDPRTAIRLAASYARLIRRWSLRNDVVVMFALHRGVIFASRALAHLFRRTSYCATGPFRHCMIFTAAGARCIRCRPRPQNGRFRYR